MDWPPRAKRSSSVAARCTGGGPSSRRRAATWRPWSPDRRRRNDAGSGGGRRRWSTRAAALAHEHPNLGKEKLHLLVAPFAAAHRLPCPSARTIGRLIADAPDKMRSRPRAFGAPGKPKPVRQPRLRKPKHFRAERPGHCVALDSIELRAQNQRRYVITCTDLHSHFAWAWATRSHASARRHPVLPPDPGRLPVRHRSRPHRQRQRVPAPLRRRTRRPAVHPLAYLSQDAEDERPLRTLQPHGPGRMHRLPLRPACSSTT